MPRRRLPPLLSLAGLLLSGAGMSPAVPQGAGPPPAGEATAPPVSYLVAEALARSPALAAIRARVEAAGESEGPASVLPDPMLEAMIQNAGITESTLGSEEMSMVGVTFRQELPHPGKRRTAGEVARTETALRRAELAELERRLELEVRAAYGRLYALDAERRVLTAARELLDLLAATAAARYAAGEAEQEAVLKAQLEVSRLAERTEDLAAEREAAVAALDRWLASASGRALGAVLELPAVEPPDLPWPERAVERAPEIATARAALAAAETRLARARQDLKPDLVAAAGLGYRGDLDPMVLLGLGVQLPTRKGRLQMPLIRAAELEVEAARRELEDAEVRTRAEVRRLAAAWRQAERQLVRFREAILPQTSAVLDAARSSYLTGRGDFSTVIEDFEEWLEARIGLARREADLFVAWAELDRIAGERGGGQETGGTP